MLSKRFGKTIMTKKVLYIGGFELPDKNAAAHRPTTVACES